MRKRLSTNTMFSPRIIHCLILLFFGFGSFAQTATISLDLYFDDNPANGLWDVGELLQNDNTLGVYLYEFADEATANTGDILSALSSVQMDSAEDGYSKVVSCNVTPRYYRIGVFDAADYKVIPTPTYDFGVSDDNDFTTVFNYPPPFPPLVVKLSGVIQIGGGTCEDVNAFGGGNPDGVMPVELGYFDAEANACNVEINWTTLSELNNAGFSLQKSTDGDNFEEIAWIPGKGNSTEEVAYQFVDEDPSATNYYRLTQVDFDGTSENSEIIIVDVTDCDNIQRLRLFPTLATDHITIMNTKKFEGITKVMITDNLGRIVRYRAVANFDEYSNYTIDVNTLHTGLYYVVVSDESNTIYPTQRFVKN